MSSQMPGPTPTREEKGQRPEDEGAVALAHRSVVTPRRPDEERGGSGKFAGAGEDDRDDDERGETPG